MPWEETSVMDQKMMFIADCLRGDEPMTVLCERHGISRQTGYVLKRRYLAEGLAGLTERSRAPHRHGQTTGAETVARLVELRKRKPYWGPKKLLASLAQAEPQLALPCASTAAEILRREGLSQPRRRRRRALTTEQPFAAVEAPNDAWCIDFKGWFKTGDGVRCDPLTVTDAFSRYLLSVRIIEPVTEAVEAEMDRLFKAHGLPKAIRSDNGPPFASSGAGGLTRLSARWARMGVRLERIWPGRPQQNGRHERMHGTLKPEACEPPSPDATQQQARFDLFRHEFNHERPHEALGQRPPASAYHASATPFHEPPDDPAYRPDELLRRVRLSGEIKWNGDLQFVSEAIAGQTVGIARRADGHWLVRYADVHVGIIDQHTGKLARLGPGRPPRTQATPQT
jgi:transposase InsO family protein